MSADKRAESARDVLKEVAGYLNFSSGSRDPKFFQNFNVLFQTLSPRSDEFRPSAAKLREYLSGGLEELSGEGGPFADVQQAQAVVALTLDELFPAYRGHHRDLLFHLEELDYVQPFFLARLFEAVLQQGPPWDERDRVVEGALDAVNDYLGYRPVAVLENNRQVEPYRHEWVCPIPLYVADAGVAAGPYELLIEKALEILQATNPELLQRAWFDLNALEELAYDPRAYDFDHPANKRPNYHFGTWDLHRIDNKGRYRRFIVQQVTLNALLRRVENAEPRRRREYLFESAAVLAGTILMASGTCGSGPETHDSGTSLATLLPHIAAYRDQFYEELMQGLSGGHAERLAAEERCLHQPFGGARQHLNQELAKVRATQLQHVHLAQIFARMGHLDAASQQVSCVRVASARMLSEVYCRLTLGHRKIDAGRLDELPVVLSEIDDLLHRAIHCGAMVDPWNIVGFGANYSLFPSPENSIHDYRVDTLVEVVERIFCLNSRAWSEAAARDVDALEKQFAACFSERAAWWDQFAAASVGDVKPVVGKEMEVSTNLVAGALSAWHRAGAASGDIGFWRMFVDQFDSPRAFQIVVEALLEKEDRVASRALLMQWLSQADRIPLEEGDSSFHRLALRWLGSLEERLAGDPQDETEGRTARQAELAETWPLVRKFFDYLEANADEYWQIPLLELNGNARAEPPDDWFMPDEPAVDDLDDDELADDEETHLFSAAYEQMTYRDSTDDGTQGDMLEGGGSAGDDYALEKESQRIGASLSFLTTVARLWTRVAVASGSHGSLLDQRPSAFAGWQRQALEFRQGLERLLGSVAAQPVPMPSGDFDSMLEYDRRRTVKDSLLDRIISTTVRMTDAARLLAAAGTAEAAGDEVAEVDSAAEGPPTVGAAEALSPAARELFPDDKLGDGLLSLLRDILAGRTGRVRERWPACLAQLAEMPILYVPLPRGGHPRQIVAARTTQRLVRNLLRWLPRLGLIRETSELLQTCQEMESRNPVGAGAVTEYDRLFEVGFKALVESVVAAGERAPAGIERQMADAWLVECLQRLSETHLKLWLRHSRTLRLSVVEKLADERSWRGFVDFVQNYCGDLLTQRFLSLGNVRSILHQGVDQWLHTLEEEPDDPDVPKLVHHLDEDVPRTHAVRYLNVALEAVVENYGEYRDYNSTTTQSDRGELFYTLIDFLRLRAEYDRVAWKLRPVVLVHEALVRSGHSEAAELWRRKLTEQTAQIADRHLQHLTELVGQYGMQLPSISDRIRERFVQPLAIDRIRSLVEPAMEEAHDEREPIAFAALEEEIGGLTSDPSGAGYDLPAWLASLEEEVSTVQLQQRHRITPGDVSRHIPLCRLTTEQVETQIEAAAEDQGELDV